ncbi:Bifunctional protein GlmU [Candidatus Tiddalikarchaeum anstoanum]|nr:Bifunctional protein GlmU [Candidatus Tiddalikarchaeum anstoanum]
MKAVILAAGEGTRFWPLSENTPKPLVRIINKYFLEYQIIELVYSGIKDIIIVKGKSFDDLFEKFKKEMQEKYDVNLNYTIQPDTLGTGDAFNRVSNLINEPFLGLMGDNHYDREDIKKILEIFNECKKCVIGGFEVTNPEAYGVIEHKGSKVQSLVEKPKKASSNIINAGIYLLKPGIFKMLNNLKPHENGEFYVTDSISQLADDDDLVLHKLKTWFDMGKPYQILDLTKYFFDNFRKFNDMKKYKEYAEGIYVDKNVTISKNVECYPGNGLIIVEEGSVILGATLIFGNVYIGPNCKVKNSVLRETSVLSGDNNVSFSEIKDSTLGLRTNAPHFNYIGDSYIGEDCNFGAGSKVANTRHDRKNIKMFIEKKGVLEDTGKAKLGVFMGNNVKIGINASLGQPGILIGSNVRIPPGAKICRNVVTS